MGDAGKVGLESMRDLRWDIARDERNAEWRRMM
jgi:hypothetical protein